MNRLYRIDFLDTLKAFIILLVIVMHTALAYLNFPAWVHNPQTYTPLIFIVLIAESAVLMPIMFFISGYLTLPSLLKRSPEEFIKAKLVRLGLPFLVGILFIAPLLWLLVAYSENSSLALLPTLVNFFTPQHISQFHFWYLGVLLFEFALVALVYWRKPGIFTSSPATLKQPSTLFFAGLIAVTTLTCFGLNLFSHYTDWDCLWIIQFQAVKTPLYNIYFLLGIYAFKQGWFKDGFRPKVFPWAGIYIASLILYALIYLATLGNPVTLYGKFLINLFASIEVLSALMTCLALFQKLHRSERPRLMKLSGLSFGVYIVHLPLLFVILFLTKDVSLAAPIKYILQAILTVVLSWGIASLPGQLSRVAKPLARPARQALNEK